MRTYKSSCRNLRNMSWRRARTNSCSQITSSCFRLRRRQLHWSPWPRKVPVCSSRTCAMMCSQSWQLHPWRRARLIWASYPRHWQRLGSGSMATCSQSTSIIPLSCRARLEGPKHLRVRYQTICPMRKIKLKQKRISLHVGSASSRCRFRFRIWRTSKKISSRLSCC